MSLWNCGSLMPKSLALEKRIQFFHSDATPLAITIEKNAATTNRMRPAYGTTTLR